MAHIARKARVEKVGKSQSCMFSKPIYLHRQLLGLERVGGFDLRHAHFLGQAQDLALQTRLAVVRAYGQFSTNARI